MPYPIRYFVAGQIWHITHRCHNREFLLDQAVYRNIWVKWLYEAKDRYGVPILNYVVTCNHIHLLVLAPEDKEAIPRTMQLVAGRTGFEYNRRKRRKGAYWEKRYHATAIQKDEHFIRCSLYIDLNMVRAKAVDHPKKWQHGGYNEIVKPKQRYRLIDHEELSRLTGMEVNSSFHKQYKCWVDNVLKQGNLSREEIWTTEVAVGSESFVEKIRKNLGFIGKKRISGFKRNEPMAVQEEIAEYGYGQSGNQLEWEIFSDL